MEISTKVILDAGRTLMGYLLPSFGTGRHAKSIEAIETYLKNDTWTSEKMKTAFLDLREAHYFYLETEIYAEKTLREALIRFHDTHRAVIDWQMIRVARTYLKLIGTRIHLVLNTSDKIAYRVFTSVSWTMLSAMAIIAAIALERLQPRGGDIGTTMANLGVFASLASIGFFVGWLGQPYVVAKRIQREIADTTNPPTPVVDPHAAPHSAGPVAEA